MLTALVLMGMVVLGPLSGPASAAGAGFTVAGGPTGDLTLPPGSVVPVDFTVINSSQQPEQIDVTITGLHFDGQTPEFTGSPSPGLDVTAQPTTMTIAGGASQSVNLSVEAAPGSHAGGLYGGVVFKEIPPRAKGQATIEEAQARPLIGHVPGPTSDTGKIQAFASPVATTTPGGVAFDLTFLDTGDIDYLLGGTMALMSGGRQVGTVTVPSDTVLPGNPREIPLAYTGKAPLGQITGVLHLTWGTSEEHSGSAQATVVVSTSGKNGSHGPGSGSRGPNHTITILSKKGGHSATASSWVFRGLALLLLLIILALLIRRYLQRRATERKLRAEGR